MLRSLRQRLGKNLNRRCLGRHRHKNRRLLLEGLEQRQMMDGGLTAALVNGVLTITGTEQDDTIIVRQINSAISVDGVSGSFGVGQIARIVVDARGGKDVVNLDSGALAAQQPITIPAEIRGGSGNEVLIGGVAGDVIIGGEGDDSLNGGSGSNYLVD